MTFSRAMPPFSCFDSDNLSKSKQTPSKAAESIIHSTHLLWIHFALPNRTHLNRHQIAIKPPANRSQIDKESIQHQ
jgi:hypothetical protein